MGVTDTPLKLVHWLILHDVLPPFPHKHFGVHSNSFTLIGAAQFYVSDSWQWTLLWEQKVTISASDFGKIVVLISSRMLRFVVWCAGSCVW